MKSPKSSGKRKKPNIADYPQRARKLFQDVAAPMKTRLTRRQADDETDGTEKPRERRTGLAEKNWWPLISRRIVGHSMVPLLPPGTYVVGRRRYRQLERGDIIIFFHDGKEKIKRIEEITPENRLFVVGEHPETSTDSRHFGAIDRSVVIAKIFWPRKPRD